ncbi:MAG: isoprenylcysteine carboxylmethyltransferase family protein [Desulfocapsaceae bacterium]|nr:isoprenylcysteine carboxylmethyltransferase family protein [Desulfocapsaceae bacterium]
MAGRMNEQEHKKMKTVPASGGGAVEKEYGALLVVCQFILLLLLAATTHWRDIHLPALLLFIASLLLAGWAVKVMRLGHFNVRPTIKSGALLVTHGPYRYIRHPMYASLLLGGVGLLLISFSWLRLVTFFALWLVLYLKVRIEEKLLADHFPDYFLYQQRSRMLFPWF